MVLLHVVEAAGAVHPPVHPVAGDLRVEDVKDLAVLLDHRDDAHRAEPSGVPRLAAALRVEGRAVEDDGRAVLMAAPGHDHRVKLQQVWVFAVQALGHGTCASLRPLLAVLGVSAPSASLPERRHRVYVFVARTGVEHDHDVVGTEVA